MKKYLNATIIILVIALANYATSALVQSLNLPFFLDTWATSLGVMAYGFPIGMLGGVVFNLVMAYTSWGPAAWIWMFSSIWVAIVTYTLWKYKCIDIEKPFHLMGSGILLGITNALLTICISLFYFGALQTYAGTESTYNAFLTLTNNTLLATIFEHLLAESVDKIITLYLAALTLSHLPKMWRKL